MYQSETFLRPRVHRGLQLNILIADLHRRATLLEADIRAEEERAHAFHSSNPTVLALHLRQRRDNILATVSLLEDRRVPAAA